MRTADDIEGDLRYWLSNEDWYPSRFTQHFLRDTPPAVAADTLARIAADAEPEPRSLWSLFVAAFATSGFLPSGGAQIGRRKAGVRAALLLADLNDGRSLAPLVRVFCTEPLFQNKYHREIEAALLRQVARTNPDGDHAPLRELLARLERAGSPLRFARLQSAVRAALYERRIGVENAPHNK